MLVDPAGKLGHGRARIAMTIDAEETAFVAGIGESPHHIVAIPKLRVTVVVALGLHRPIGGPTIVLHVAALRHIAEDCLPLSRVVTTNRALSITSHLTIRSDTNLILHLQGTRITGHV